MADDYNDPLNPGIGLGVSPFGTPSSADAEDEAVFKRWDSLRQPPTGATPPPAPEVGTSPLAQELEQSGWLAQQEAAHASQMDREIQEAIARSQAGAPPPAPKAESRPSPEPVA